MFIVNGRWQRISHREDLLGLFPSSPEIYHSKSDNPSNNIIGQFGSAESPNGELRALCENEARQIELDTGVYRQILLEEQFETFLQKKLG
ncbi:MAG TPA: hypothetical protein DCY03_14180 [Planctomycetaceae bacterium]|nr:hypothetical protein [Planctomycetaceae bacterium]|tara:strand:- start:1122 stop:1391 length:270 start_codon:yes stop_codon:yes gene_type:complete